MAFAFSVLDGGNEFIFFNNFYQERKRPLHLKTVCVEENIILKLIDNLLI